MASNWMEMVKESQIELKGAWYFEIPCISKIYPTSHGVLYSEAYMGVGLKDIKEGGILDPILQYSIFPRYI